MGKYDKFTKAQLIVELESLEHVGSSIIEKDRAYNILNDSINEKIKEARLTLEEKLLKKDQKIKELNDILKSSDDDVIKKIGELSNEKMAVVDGYEAQIAELQKKHEEDVSKRIQLVVEPFKKENERLIAFGDRRSKELSKIMSNHGSLLKALQGVSEIAINLNEYMYEEFSRKEK